MFGVQTFVRCRSVPSTLDISTSFMQRRPSLRQNDDGPQLVIWWNQRSSYYMVYSMRSTEQVCRCLAGCVRNGYFCSAQNATATARARPKQLPFCASVGASASTTCSMRRARHESLFIRIKIIITCHSAALLLMLMYWRWLRWLTVPREKPRQPFAMPHKHTHAYI